MSNAKLGALHGTIAIDRTAPAHYGSKDKITGTVTLNYKTASSLFNRNVTTADLFGPLKIQVILQGKVRIKVRRDRSHHMPTSHGMIIFEQPFSVFDGSFKAEVGNEFKYPFTAIFPEDGKASYPTPGIGLYSTLMRSGQVSTQLPPSMAHHFSDYPDVVDFAIMYRLGLQIEMPGIDIKAIVPERGTRPHVKYDFPRPEQSLIDDGIKPFTMQAKVQNEYLLPEEERPSGFKAKAKAVFTSSHFPELVTDVTCTGYDYIYPGQDLKFEIVLRRNDLASTTTMFPETVLESFKVEISAFVAVNTSDRLIGQTQCNDRRIVQVMLCQTSLPQTFSKANDHSITVTTSSVAKHPSSFIQQKIALQYLLRVSMQLKVANKTLKQTRELPIVIVPPPGNAEWVPQPPPEAGPSQPYVDDDLPTYGEAGSSKLLESAT